MERETEVPHELQQDWSGEEGEALAPGIAGGSGGDAVPPVRSNVFVSVRSVLC